MPTPGDPAYNLTPRTIQEIVVPYFEGVYPNQYSPLVPFENPQFTPNNNYDVWIIQNPFGGLRMYGIYHDVTSPTLWTIGEKVELDDLIEQGDSYSFDSWFYWIHERAFLVLSQGRSNTFSSSSHETNVRARIFVINGPGDDPGKVVLQDEYIAEVVGVEAEHTFARDLEIAYMGFTGPPYMGHVLVYEHIDEPGPGGGLFGRHIKGTQITLDTDSLTGLPRFQTPVDLGEVNRPYGDPEYRDFTLKPGPVSAMDGALLAIYSTPGEPDKVGRVEGLEIAEGPELEEAAVGIGYPIGNMTNIGVADYTSLNEYDVVSPDYPPTVIQPFVEMPIPADAANGAVYSTQKNSRLPGIPQYAHVQHDTAYVLGIRREGEPDRWGCDFTSPAHAAFFPGSFAVFKTGVVLGAHYAGNPFRVGPWAVTWKLVDKPTGAGPDDLFVSPVVWIPDEFISGDPDFVRARFTAI